MTALDAPVLVRDASKMRPHEIGADDFKEALARLASGLAIISSWRGDEAHGLLVSSITGLSTAPPRFLFCVRRDASAHDALAGARMCGVSILSSTDEDEARTFMEPELRRRRFASSRWRAEAPAPPLLKSSLAAAVCRVDSVTDAGTHSILIVTAHTLVVRAGEPLLSFDRDLRRLAPANLTRGA